MFSGVIATFCFPLHSTAMKIKLYAMGRKLSYFAKSNIKKKIISSQKFYCFPSSKNSLYSACEVSTHVHNINWKIECIGVHSICVSLLISIFFFTDSYRMRKRKSCRAVVRRKKSRIHGECWIYISPAFDGIGTILHNMARRLTPVSAICRDGREKHWQCKLHTFFSNSATLDAQSWRSLLIAQILEVP